MRAVDVAIFGRRSIRRALRSSETMVNTVVFPLLLLLTLLAAFSSAVEAFDGESYAQRLIPALVVSGVMFGSTGAAFGLLSDLQSGFMDRVRSLPVSPTAMLLGTAAGEFVRACGVVIVLVGAGHLFGFRFHNGVVAAAAFILVAAMAASVIVWIGLALATQVRSLEALGPPLGGLFLVLLFFSKGLVPLDAYPTWAHGLVQAGPITAYVELLDGLARGGPLAGAATMAAVWSVVIVVVFGAIAVRRLQTAAGRGGS